VQQLDFILKVSDIECEQLLLNSSAGERIMMSHHKQPHTDWRDLAFLSAYLSAQEICFLRTERCTPSVVIDIVIKKFTNRNYQFYSNEHFIQVKTEIIQHMLNFFTSQQHDRQLIAGFESFTVSIDELDIELTQQFHMMYYEPSSNNYIVQRLMRDQNDTLLQLHYHMTAIFAARAFNGITIRFEVFFPLSGKKKTWEPYSQCIQQSLDYMALLKTLLLDDDCSLQ